MAVNDQARCNKFNGDEDKMEESTNSIINVLTSVYRSNSFKQPIQIAHFGLILEIDFASGNIVSGPNE